MFNPVSSRVNFPQLEEKILSWWKSSDIFQRSIEARQGGQAPHHIYRMALDSGRFKKVKMVKTLGVLKRIGQTADG